MNEFKTKTVMIFASSVFTAFLLSLTQLAGAIVIPPVNLPPGPPVNLSPLDGSVGASLTPTLEASSFADLNSEDTHASSQWQVDQDVSFAAPEYDSGETAAEKTAIVIPKGPLACSRIYHWRVRYKDSQGAWSPWSYPTSFTTVNAPAHEKWSGAVDVSLKFSVYVQDSSGNEKFGSKTVPFTGTIEIYWVNEERNLTRNEEGCYIYFEGSNPYGPASFCITQKASMLTDNVNATASDTAYLKGNGTLTARFEGEDLEGPIFIDVTGATFKKDKTGALASITVSAKVGGGTDDFAVFSGSFKTTLTKENN
ncbi:MAG: hypothetical protein EHM36_00505 [Deltaproteobacteria bacterium]|nr:MAG: hypothetical protein EHM36_00505 [Deltaproteobacteria bacterium]